MTQLDRKYWIGGALAIGVLATGVFTYRNVLAPGLGIDSAGSELPKDERELRELWGSRDVDSASIQRDWEPGDQFRWRMSFSSELAVGDDQRDVALEQKLEGTWEATVLAVGPDQQARFHVVLSGLELSFHGQDPLEGEQAQFLEEAFAQPVVWEMRADGSIPRIGVAEHLLAPAQQTSKQIAGMAQFVVPTTPRSSWEITEEDAQGRAKAHYARDDNGHFTKQRDSYSAVLASPVERDLQLKDARADVVWSATRHIEHLEASEKLLQRSTDYFPSTIASSSLSMELVEIAKVPADEVDAMRAEVADHIMSPLWGELTAFARRAALDEAWIAGLSLDGILDQLAELGESEADTRKRLRLYAAMVALFRQDARARAEALRLLENDHEQAVSLIGALGESGHPEAQTGLMNLVQSDALDTENRVWAAVGTTRAGAPPKEVVEGLEGLFDDPELADQARYGLGSASALLRGTDPERADALGEILVDEFNNSKTRGNRRRALLALGNAEYPGALDAVRDALKDPDPKIRRAAISAIRDIDDPEVDEILATFAVKDNNGDVRYEALRSMHGRSPAKAHLPAMYLIVSKDPILRVRQSAVALAGSPRWKPDAVRPIFEYVAQNETDRSLRDTASRRLAAM